MEQVMHEFLTQMNKNDLHINFIQIHQHGKMVYDYRRIKNNMRLNTWSVSKAFVSVAAGIAMEEGILSMEEKLADSFQEQLPEKISTNLESITVKHLLTMTTGLEKPLFFSDDPECVRTQDWIKYFFTVGNFMYTPGTQFLYSNFNTYMLACLIEKKAGQGFVEYCIPRMFTPLEIYSPVWTKCPMGHVHASNGLNLNIQEMSNFGEMILNKGTFHGKRIVPADFIKEATTMQFDTGEPENAYGYCFRVDTTRNAAREEGRYGQLIFILPEKETVIAVQSLEEKPIIPLINEYIIDCLN